MNPQHLPSQADIERELIRRNGLREFIKRAWGILHPPEKPFIDNWHVGAVAEHVQAVYDGDIHRLLINIPPRTMKTLTTSVFAPAWGWSKNPSLKYIFAAYSGDLSGSAADKTKNIILSSWYKERWGERVSLSDTQNTKLNFETTENGAYLATSVGGISAGKGADIITCDDLMKPVEAESQLKRRECSNYFWETLSSRFDNRVIGRLIVVAQRLHPDDIPGEILAREVSGVGGRWEKLILPLEYHPKTYVTCLGFKDPRTEDKEPLDKVRFPRETIESLKQDLGAYAYAAQMDQVPVPREGGMVKESWFRNRYQGECNAITLNKRRENDRNVVMVVQSVDCASKAKQRNDPTVWETYAIVLNPPTGEKKERTYHVELWDVERGRYEFPEGLRKFQRLGDIWNPDLVLIEDKDAGQQYVQLLGAARDYKWKIEKCDPEGLDKGTRMAAETAMIERGDFWLPEAALWLQDFLTELCLFTGNNSGGFDDQCDSASQFLKWFRRKFTKRKVVAPSGEEEGSSHFIGLSVDMELTGEASTPPWLGSG